MRIALESNLDLEISRSLVRDAGEEIEVRRAEFDPTAVLDGTYANRRQPVASSDLDGADRPESNDSLAAAAVEKQFSSGMRLVVRSDLYDRNETNSSFARINPEFNSALRLDVSQPLLKNAGAAVNLAPIRLAALGYDRANIEATATLIDTLVDTEQAYWTLVAATAAEDIRRRSLDLADLIVRESAERRKVNLATQIDVLEAEASASEKREALLISVRNTREAADQLFEVMGILREIQPGGLDLEALPSSDGALPDPVDSFQQALETSPESLLYQNAIRAREVELAAARRNRLPELDLNLNSGILGRGDAQSDALAKVGERDGYFWEVGLRFRVPWGLRLEKAQLAQALEALERAQVERRRGELGLLAQIRSACRDIELARERIDAASVTAELNRQRFEQRKSERAAGESTMRDLLEAQEDLEDASLRVIESRVELLRSIVLLGQLEGSLPQRHGIDIGPPGAVLGVPGQAVRPGPAK